MIIHDQLADLATILPGIEASLDQAQGYLQAIPDQVRTPPDWVMTATLASGQEPGLP